MVEFEIIGKLSGSCLFFSPRKHSENGSRVKDRLAYNPSDFSHGFLPPPLHVDDYLRRREVDFQLPFDLWWMHNYNLVRYSSKCTVS